MATKTERDGEKTGFLRTFVAPYTKVHKNKHIRARSGRRQARHDGNNAAAGQGPGRERRGEERLCVADIALWLPAYAGGRLPSLKFTPTY